MARRRTIIRAVVIALSLAAAVFVGGFLFTPPIDVAAHKPTGYLLWSRIEAHGLATGRFPDSEEELLSAGIFTRQERTMYLDRHFGHRKFLYMVDEKLGPGLGLSHMPGALYKVTVWRLKTNAPLNP
jgi:hypothetical protein